MVDAEEFATQRGMQGKHGGSILTTYRPIPAHAFSVAYYGNSTISGRHTTATTSSITTRGASYCGPASIATVLRAYGAKQADQTALLPSFGATLKVFFTGVSSDELDLLVRTLGLRSEVVHADSLNIDNFRERISANLSRTGDYILVNYDRRVLRQSSAGHISPIGAYDATRDEFLVLDEAEHQYPFTWIPTAMLFAAAHTQGGERFRELLLIPWFRSSWPGRRSPQRPP